jgi:hypothetical protein
MEEVNFKNEFLRIKNAVENVFDKIELKISELSPEQMITVSEKLDIYEKFIINLQLRLNKISLGEKE